MASSNASAERKKEADLIRRFMAEDSTLWEWLRTHLLRQQGKLIVQAGNPTISAEARALLVGKLSLVTEILHRPAHILSIAEEVEAIQEPYKHPKAPRGAPGAL